MLQTFSIHLRLIVPGDLKVGFSVVIDMQVTFVSIVPYKCLFLPPGISHVYSNNNANELRVSGLPNQQMTCKVSRGGLFVVQGENQSC